MTTSKAKKRVQMSRSYEAALKDCADCRGGGKVTQAEDFCGCWRNDIWEECKRPLCRNCADIRLNVWRCKRCAGKTIKRTEVSNGQ